MRWAWFVVLAGVSVADCRAQDGAGRQAIERGLAIVQKAARTYPEHRDCFSCHHQTLPLLAMQASRDAALEIDKDVFAAQMDFTRESFASRTDVLASSDKHVGGKAMTVAYGLWTWHVAGREPDSVSEAMAAYLLRTQEADGRWRPPSHRPPLEESQVACTVLAAYALERYSPEASRDAAKGAVERACAWLKTAELLHHEDFVFTLWGKLLLRAADAERDNARRQLLAAQRDDGSWSQEKDMPGDAYATGQAVYVLRESGLPSADAALHRAEQFLLMTQQADGSWHVATRSKPVQVYFDNGDPHGHDQFISIPATAWATAALARLAKP